MYKIGSRSRRIKRIRVALIDRLSRRKLSTPIGFPATALAASRVRLTKFLSLREAVSVPSVSLVATTKGKQPAYT